MLELNVVAEPGVQSFTITRVFDAPRGLVFMAFTDAKHIPNWWGPARLTTTVDCLDARTGGSWRFVQKESTGTEHAFHGVFHEVALPSRIVQTFEYEPMAGHVQLEAANFEEADGKTTVTTKAVFLSVEDRDGMIQSGMESGLRESYERLDELLREMGDVRREGGTLVIERIFDAPRELVWKAWTDPGHVKLWWGPKDYSAPVAEIDLRVGGKYLYCMRSPDGHDGWTTGTFREIVPMERIVATNCFSDPQGNVVPPTRNGMPPDMATEMLQTVTFEDLGPARTKLTLRVEGLPTGLMSEMATMGWMQSLNKFGESLVPARPSRGNTRSACGNAANPRVPRET